MIKQKFKSLTPKPIWFLLSESKSTLLNLTVPLVLRLANSKSPFLNFFVRSRVKELIWLDTIKPIKTFRESEIIKAFEPDYGDQSSFMVERPSISLYEFKNASVHGESSHIILHDSIVMERLPHIPVEHCNYSTAFIKGHDNNFAIYGSKYEAIDIDKAFFLGGNGSWNYYHWTVEIVAKLKYFLMSDIAKTDISIVLPDHGENIESFSVMLEIILKNKYDLHFISRHQIANIKHLYAITTPSNVVFNTSYGERFKKNHLFYDRESIDFIRESILSSAQYKDFLETIKDTKVFKKVYLARKDNAARSHNQVEVLNLVVKKGFVPVYLEELSFFKQVHLFQNADILIGASGAAWTNIIYSKPKSKGISWLGENIKSFSCYSTLGKYYECDLKFFSCEVENEKFNHSPYIVDLQTLSKKISECY